MQSRSERPVPASLESTSLQRPAVVRSAKNPFTTGQEGSRPPESRQTSRRRRGRISPTQQIHRPLSLNDNRSRENVAQRKGQHTNTRDLPPVQHKLHGEERKVDSSIFSNGTAQRAPAIQRVLQIEDKGKTFYNQKEAEDYFKEHFRKRKIKLSKKSEEWDRLTELAQKANDQNEFFPINTLKEAVDYIVGNQHLNIYPSVLRPDETPERKKPHSEKFDFAVNTEHSPPSRLKLPQSPLNQSSFPQQEEEANESLDIRQVLNKTKKDIEKWKKDSKKLT